MGHSKQNGEGEGTQMKRPFTDHVKKYSPSVFIFCLLLFQMILGVNNHALIEHIDDFKKIKNEHVDWLNFRVHDSHFETNSGGNWRIVPIRGVNLGITKPGHFPESGGITYSDYRRWIRQIDEMNANVIRTFTAHPPSFYHALRDHNRNDTDPILLFQGIWFEIPDHVVIDSMEMSRQSDLFMKEINRTIDIIHGKYREYPQPSGESIYDADISEYVIGLILGSEWSQDLVFDINNNISSGEVYEGDHLYCENGNEFENWMTRILDLTVDYEYQRYLLQTPLSFITTPLYDPVDHPGDPQSIGGKLTIDPDNIRETDEYYPGLFATYHIYPYYPEFLNYQEKYVNYIDKNGKKNSYAGYLNDLRQDHNTTIVVGEFGVPSSRGISHRNPSGFDQGYLNESEQGRIDSLLFSSIMDEGLAGGMIFNWQDEYFKTSWNTRTFINRSRTAYWSDIQTPEQCYGLLSFVPGGGIVIDGKSDDWLERSTGNDHEPINGGVDRFQVHSDERYVYMLIDVKRTQDTEDQVYNDVLVMIDTIGDQGLKDIKYHGDVRSDRGIDFVIDLKWKGGSRVMVHDYYDPFIRKYPEYCTGSGDLDPDNGTLHPIRMMLSGPITFPDEGVRIPPQIVETGLLNSISPGSCSSDNDPTVDCVFNEYCGIIEARIPWSLLGFRDPSTGEIIGDLGVSGLRANSHIDSIDMGVITYNDPSTGSELPGDPEYHLKNESFYCHFLKGWDMPNDDERLKGSYYVIRNTFEKYSIIDEPAR